jgi:phage-related protein (TIGR01555 family)
MKSKKKQDNKSTLVFDEFNNPFSGFGGSGDQVNLVRFSTAGLTALDFVTIENIFCNDWIARRLLEEFPNESLKKGIEFITDDSKISQAVHDYFKRFDLIRILKEAQISADLYGGALIYIGIAEDDPTKPLNIGNLNKIDFFHILDRQRVSIQQISHDPLSENFNKPEFYTVSSSKVQKVHHSRVIRFDGEYLPNELSIVNGYWHGSKMQHLYKVIRNFSISQHAAANTLQDFIKKIWKISNLWQKVATNQGSEAVKNRAKALRDSMSMVGMLAIDKEEEEVDVSQNPVTGFSDILDRFMTYISAASKIPKARLFGQSLGTVTGGDQTEKQFKHDVESYRETKFDRPLERLFKLILMQKEFITKGVEPESWSFKYGDLFHITKKEDAEIREIQSKIDLNATGGEGWLSIEEIRENRYNEDGTTNYNTKIDSKDLKKLNEPDQDNDNSD